MTDVRLFRRRAFSVGNVVMFLASIAFGGTLFLLPLLLQGERNLSALQTGLLVAPHAVGILIATPVAGRLYGRLGARPLLAAGMLGIATATAGFLLVDLTTPVVLIGALMLFAGLAFGTTIWSLQTVPFSGLGLNALGHASAVLNVVRQVALAFGTALLVTTLSAGLARGVGAVARGARPGPASYGIPEVVPRCVARVRSYSR